MSPQNILIVEDDRETRTLIAKYRRANGCNPIAISDGEEMTRVMAVCRVDLLILDLMLPGESLPQGRDHGEAKGCLWRPFSVVAIVPL